ncbi:protein kinase [Nonomuraea sp. NBC_01738]|uniref:serine/threonine-protein kinase n=1 Tax=Nonomuraea sp. NBC_01738 TaxID=2976003 RepID=UPI002E0F8BF5|nr:protein kinase [Nonomuraea sp. NBC_01738]
MNIHPSDPESIAGYRLTGLLGEGGQGAVYRGVSPEGGPVAVKISLTRIGRDPDVQRLFLKEVEAARKVAPFSTARILDVGVHEDRPYIVSEYVPGPSLHELVTTDGPRTGGGLQRLAIATLTALDAIHAAGVVHRDLKPSNVIMGPEGPVVIDFGIARALDRATTRSGLMGTPSYMAPELFLAEPASAASDVFAWAATMVYAATGRQAFHGETLPAVMNAIMNGSPDLTGVPDELVGLLANCLTRDPATRPAVEELRATLTGAGPHGQATRAVWTGRTQAVRPAPTKVMPPSGPVPRDRDVPSRPVRGTAPPPQPVAPRRRPARKLGPPPLVAGFSGPREKRPPRTWPWVVVFLVIVLLGALYLRSMTGAP